MSWKAVNEILGLASVDQDFYQGLQTNPLAAVQERGFVLTPEEQEVFRSIVFSNLQELSQLLLEKLGPDAK